MLPCLIFDLDGTILDTLEGIRAHLNTARAAFELPAIDTDRCRSLIGNGLRRLVQDSMEGSDRADLVPSILQELRESYAANPGLNTHPYPGIPGLLADLKSEGHILAVATNKEEPLARELVKRFFPGIFEQVFGAAPPRPLKPNPAVVQEIRRAYPDRRCLLIGDSTVDERTAQAAAIPFVGVSWGFGASEDLRSGHGFLADTVQQLRIILNHRI